MIVLCCAVLGPSRAEGMTFDGLHEIHQGPVSAVVVQKQNADLGIGKNIDRLIRNKYLPIKMCANGNHPLIVTCGVVTSNRVQ